MKLEEKDVIVATVTLKTNDAPNDSNIKKEWEAELREWCIKNDCIIEHIEWSRYRCSLKTNEKSQLELHWDPVERSKGNA